MTPSARGPQPPPQLSGGRARTQRVLILVGQVAALTCWFSASAVSANLKVAFHIGEQSSVLLSSAVQLGFVIGALSSATLNVADRVPPSRLYGVSALVAATCTALLALFVRDFGLAVLLRLLTGVALAGVYPVGMKLMASWSTPATRGRALGLLVGGLTLGSATPQLIRGVQSLTWQWVLLIAAIVTALGGLLVGTLCASGPNIDARATHFDPKYAVRMFRELRPRLATIGYLGHMWELYALWTWLPTFILSSQEVRGDHVGSGVNVVAFVAIGIAGFAGCLVGGLVADRIGRAPAAVTALVVSGTCCLLSPVFYGRSLPVLAVFLVVWGAAVIADSGVFSTALSETANQRLVGTALTAQTAFGFLLTVVSIQLVSVFVWAAGWRFAFMFLALGPVIGAIAMTRFGRAARATPEPVPRPPARLRSARRSGPASGRYGEQLSGIAEQAQEEEVNHE